MGDLFTPADIFLGQTLSVADGFGGLVPDKYVGIKAYHKRILERPAAQKAYA
jgi:glutathione S-transferase